MIYVDDGIFVGPDKEEIEQLFKELHAKFNITDKGDLAEYPGVLMEKQSDGRTKLFQPQLVEQILNDLWFNGKTKSKAAPAPGEQVLEGELNAEPNKDEFHYGSVIGKANFLEKSTSPDITVAIPQCLQFSSNPKQCHADAMRYFGRYLQGTQNEGMYLDPKATSRLSAGLMRISLVCTSREPRTLSWMISQLNPGQGSLSLMQDVQSQGPARCSAIVHRIQVHCNVGGIPSPNKLDGSTGGG
jgi:hypothetical protein